MDAIKQGLHAVGHGISAVADKVTSVADPLAAKMIPDTPEHALSPLWAAIMANKLADVEAAIAAGADLNERLGAEKDTPLTYVCRRGQLTYPPHEIPAALIRAGADLEAPDGHPHTAVQIALMAGAEKTADLLIKSGANTDGVEHIKSKIHSVASWDVLKSHQILKREYQHEPSA